MEKTFNGFLNIKNSDNVFIKESNYPRRNISEGDMIVVTKKGKYFNQTGVVIYVYDENDRSILVNDIDVKLDYIDKEIPFQFYDVEKLDVIKRNTDVDPYGEEDWRESPYEKYII